MITPDVFLHPHNASLEMTFYDGQTISRGISRRHFCRPSTVRGIDSDRAGYELIRVPSTWTGHTTGEYEDFMTGFVVDSGHVWGRPVGVTVAPDGSLLVTDDGSKSIWRISYTGK